MVQDRTGPKTGSDRTGVFRSGPRSRPFLFSVFGPVRSWTGWTNEWTGPDRCVNFFWGGFVFRFPAPASNLNNLNPASRILSRIPDLHLISRLSLPQPQLSSGFIIILDSLPLSTQSLSLSSLRLSFSVASLPLSSPFLIPRGWLQTPVFILLDSTRHQTFSASPSPSRHLQLQASSSPLNPSFSASSSVLRLPVCCVGFRSQPLGALLSRLQVCFVQGQSIILAFNLKFLGFFCVFDLWP